MTSRSRSARSAAGWPEDDGGAMLSAPVSAVAWTSPKRNPAVLSRVLEGLRRLPEDAEDDAEGENARVIRASFEAAGRAGDKLVPYFYGRLFAAHPTVRGLFPATMEQQRDRLFHALTRIVQTLDSPDEMAAYLRQLGRDHRKFAAEPAHYAAVGDALVATLRKFAGPAWTPAAESAWTQAYAQAATLMMDAADQDAAKSPPWWTAEVVEHELRAPGLAVVTVRPDRPLPYRGGQAVTVQHPRWHRVWRPYSVACAPRDDGLLIFHVKAVPGGWVSNALVRDTSVGDGLLLGPAVGKMIAPRPGRRLVCVAGGTGLAPLKALVEQDLRDSSAAERRGIFLFFGARRAAELYDLTALRELARRCPWVHVYPVVSDDRGYRGLQGQVGDVAARLMPRIGCEAYLSGPPDMIRKAAAKLATAGIPERRLHHDLAAPRA